MIIFIGIGVLSFVVGILFIISPTTLKTLNTLMEKMVINLEEKVFTYRLGLGISLIIASMLFFFVAYYISIKG